MPLLNIATAAGATAIRASTTTGMTAGNEIRIDVGPFREVRHIVSIVTPNPASPATNIVLDAPLTMAHGVNAQSPRTAPSTGSSVGVGFQPNFAQEGIHEAMEFANGHYGLIDAALAYQNDHTAPTSSMITKPEGSPTGFLVADPGDVQAGQRAVGDLLHARRIYPDVRVSEVGGPGL